MKNLFKQRLFFSDLSINSKPAGPRDGSVWPKLKASSVRNLKKSQCNQWGVGVLNRGPGGLGGVYILHHRGKEASLGIEQMGQMNWVWGRGIPSRPFPRCSACLAGGSVLRLPYFLCQCLDP